MHDVIATFAPASALAVGQNRVEALPPAVIAALRAGQVNLADPAVTVELVRLNSVLGVKATVNETGRLASVGITCAFCHSTVYNPFAGHRQAAGWMGESHPERRRNRRLVAGASRCAQGRIPDVGAGQVRSAAPCVRRHQPRAVEHPVAADCDSVDLRIGGRGLRDVHRRPTERQPATTGRRPCADYGSTRRIFMTEARPTCVRWSSTTTGCLGCVCPVRGRPILSRS
jgi:hypothetical protein